MKNKGHHTHLSKQRHWVFENQKKPLQSVAFFIIHDIAPIIPKMFHQFLPPIMECLHPIMGRIAQTSSLYAQNL
jgi:hypothetical protein